MQKLKFASAMLLAAITVGIILLAAWSTTGYLFYLLWNVGIAACFDVPAVTYGPCVILMAGIHFCYSSVKVNMRR